MFRYKVDVTMLDTEMTIKGFIDGSSLTQAKLNLINKLKGITYQINSLRVITY